MLAILHLLAMFVADLFKPRRQLEVENLFLRHQLNIALRRAPSRLRLRGSDWALLVWMSRLWSSLLRSARIFVQPDMILRWHRAGFCAYWALEIRGRAMGIRDRPISPRSPWQNPYVERLIGTLRRDCLDHVLIFGARHLRAGADVVLGLL
jgi:hypothetical protein